MINALVHLPPKQPFRKLPWFSVRLPATGAIFVGELVPNLVACTRLVELEHKNRQRLEPTESALTAFHRTVWGAPISS
jgi:hypothetical protein